MPDILEESGAGTGAEGRADEAFREEGAFSPPANHNFYHLVCMFRVCDSRLSLLKLEVSYPYHSHSCP